MAFRCDVCYLPQKSGVKPFLIVPKDARRPKEYLGYRFDEEGDQIGGLQVVGVGWEPTHEVRTCPACMGIKPANVEADSQRVTRLRAMSGPDSEVVKHVRKCKSLLSDCARCQQIVLMYEGLSLPDLNIALSEPPIRPQTYKAHKAWR